MSDKFNEQLLRFFQQNKVRGFTCNNKIVPDVEGAMKALLSLLDEFEDENISGDILDYENYARFTKANEVAKEVFPKILKIEIECEPSKSTAMSTFVINGSIMIDVENERERMKAFADFINLVDFIDIGSVTNPTETEICFAIHNVWREGGSEH